MKRTPDGQRYWLEISGLEPGKEYVYQYLVDGALRITDPYAHKILDPWNDGYISNTTYPGLIPYPTGKTTGIAGVFQTAREPYNWEVTNFTPPNPADLVIYELHIRDFVATRDIKTVIDTLDYLEKLGVNAIELMPISGFADKVVAFGKRVRWSEDAVCFSANVSGICNCCNLIT
jgi:1,4-alpha-glucan branching enzyme